MMKRNFTLVACGCSALILSGCGQEPAAPAASSIPFNAAEAANPPDRPALSGMSRRQREVFRIQETAAHLAQVVGILKQLDAAGGLKLASGARPDLGALENTLVLIRQDTQVEPTDPPAVHPNQNGGKLDALFTQVLELEKQVDWPEDSPERKEVAASLVAASEVFEAAVPLNREGAEAAPAKSW